MTSGSDAEYVAALIRILRAARLNAHYPDARKLISHLGAMCPKRHRGLYGDLEIHRGAGLPAYAAWVRVKVDVEGAAARLADLGDRRELDAKARRGDDPIWAKQRDKYDYYDDIREVRLAELGGMQVALRRVEPSTSSADILVRFDKLDASGVFVRYTMELTQTDSIWSQAVVELDGETAEHTKRFESLIYKLTSVDPELTYLKLHALDGVRVDRVIKGAVGPFFWPGADISQVAALLAEPTDFLASFGLTTVATDVTEDRSNDPLDALLPEAPSPSASGDHRVFKDRKFVVPRHLAGGLRDLCASVGTKNVIYST